MIQVTIGSNLDQKTVIYPETAVIGDILSENHIPENRMVHIDGSPVTDKTKTLAEFGVTESCFIIAVTKADNA